MAVYKRYRGQRITSKDPNYAKARWWMRKKIAGRTIHQSIPEAQTKEQAELAERKIIEALYRHKYGIQDTKTTFAEFADGPYTRYVDQNNVNKGAKYLYIRLLKERFRKQLLSEITPQDCRDCQHELRRKMSDSSVNRVMSTASRLFTLACEEGIIDRNPMQYVKMLKEPPPRSRLLTGEEKERLWTELAQDELLSRLVTLALNLPLRKGQLLAITPDAVDWQNGQLFVIQSKGRAPRAVPLNSLAVTTLQLMNSDNQLPFPLKDFRRRWIRLLASAGITGFRFHDLRREFASELIRKNVNPNIVQKLFAHSDMSITNVYMHSEMDQLKEAVNTLDDVQDGGEQ